MNKRTNIVIDLSKLARAKKLARLKTTREVVNFALERLTKSVTALDGLTRLRGKIHFTPKYNYKGSR